MKFNPASGVIETKVLIQAAPTVIFRALTEAKDLAQWFCDRATSDARIGGELKAFWRMGNHGQARRGCAVFISLMPDAKVELDWVDEGSGESAPSVRHTICYTIRLKRGTAEVTVRDAGPPFEDEETLEALSEGWISVLRDLKDHCEAKQRSSRRQYMGEFDKES
jgi:uncharacterized protein YndB with AHSA1/START domain